MVQYYWRRFNVFVSISINVAGMAIMDAGELTLAAEICRLTLHIDTVTRERRIRERRLPKVQKRT